ncbi:MAG: hypothetical protein IK038_14170 [Bacteroidaceae bacterium]|nr:hypothetical protein [Bacteroidaceae bacterium]
MNRKMTFFAMATLTILLLAGCGQGNPKGSSSQKKNETNASASIDTSTLDEGFQEQTPKMEVLHPDSLIGSWQWLHTYCSIGNLSCKVHWCMVLRFERGNKLSVDFNGKTIVEGAKYTLKKAEENPYGEYLITVPEEVRKVVFENVGDLPEAILNGYASFTTINKGYEMKCLVITDTEVTGQSDLHQSSTFRKVDEEHPARPLRWWSEGDYEGRR